MSDEHVSLRGQEITLRLYKDDVDEITLVFDGDRLPLTVGGKFSGRVVAITRRVTER